MPVLFLPKTNTEPITPIEAAEADLDIAIPKKSAFSAVRFFRRLWSALLCALLVSGAVLELRGNIEPYLIPDGYVRQSAPETPAHASLDVSGLLLPDSRLEAEITEVPPTEAADPDEAVIPEGELRIVDHDFSGVGLSNETDYSPDLDALLKAPLPFDSYVRSVGFGGPTVLIIHTHGTEAYSDEDALSYPADSGMRSSDITENVVAVGSAVAERLEAAGIGVLHLTEMFDAESYYNSYNRSCEAVLACLETNPTIRIVIDLHRDAAADAARGIAYKPVTTIDGEKHAQLMLVVGTDHLGAPHPDWSENLSVAVKLQDMLCGISPTLMRPINLRGASFNQQYSPGSLLLEVGSCSNTLEEAKRSGRLFADCLAELLNN